MADKIFINYRRQDSIGTAGRLHDRLALAFGRDNLFMDVDNIPAGVDFEAHLNSQVAACNILLVVIGPHWLNAKDEAGQPRLHQPDDFVAIEIAEALTRNIRVIPVLVDGARMPKAGELPDPLKPLVRRQAVEVNQLQFGRDAEALVEKIREALNGGPVGRRPWRGTALAGVAALILFLVGWVGFNRAGLFASVPPTVQLNTRDVDNAKAAAQAEAKRKAEQAEQQRVAALKAEQERQARAEAEAEAKRKAEQAEQQRVAALKAEQERQARAEAEAEAKRKAEQAEQQRVAALKAEQERQARAEAEAEAKRKSEEAEQQRLAALRAEQERNRAETVRYSALLYQGVTVANSGDYDKAIATFSEAMTLDPKNALAFGNRGLAYAKKGDYDRAIADFNEAIRLNPNDGRAFCNRGTAKLKIKDKSGNRDIAKARQLDASVCQ